MAEVQELSEDVKEPTEKWSSKVLAQVGKAKERIQNKSKRPHIDDPSVREAEINARIQRTKGGKREEKFWGFF